MKPCSFIAKVGDTGDDPDTPLQETDSIVAAVQYKPKKKREDEARQNQKVQSSQSSKTNADLKQEFNLSDNCCQYQQEFVQMFETFSNMWNGYLRRISVTKHRTKLMPGGTPVHPAPYQAGPKVCELQRVEFHRMREQKLIEQATTEWTAPIVFVPSKDGTLRFCVDYGRLDALAQRDSYNIPRMDECIDSLGKSTAIFTLDASSEYW